MYKIFFMLIVSFIVPCHFPLQSIYSHKKISVPTVFFYLHFSFIVHIICKIISRSELRESNGFTNQQHIFNIVWEKIFYSVILKQLMGVK